MMLLRCPKCDVVADYGGWPANPILSTVYCLACGHAAPGAAFARLAEEARKEEPAMRRERIEISETAV